MNVYHQMILEADLPKTLFDAMRDFAAQRKERARKEYELERERLRQEYARHDATCMSIRARMRELRRWL